MTTPLPILRDALLTALPGAALGLVTSDPQAGLRIIAALLVFALNLHFLARFCAGFVTDAAHGYSGAAAGLLSLKTFTFLPLVAWLVHQLGAAPAAAGLVLSMCLVTVRAWQSAPFGAVQEF